MYTLCCSSTVWVSGHNAVLRLWFGSDTKTTRMGLGTHHGLALNTTFDCCKHGWKCPGLSFKNIQRCHTLQMPRHRLVLWQPRRCGTAFQQNVSLYIVRGGVRKRRGGVRDGGGRYGEEEMQRKPEQRTKKLQTKAVMKE